MGHSALRLGSRGGSHSHSRPGEMHGAAVLTEDLVRAGRQALATGRVSSATLARQYGVSEPAIIAMAYGRTWNHVPGILRQTDVRAARIRAAMEDGRARHAGRRHQGQVTVELPEAIHRALARRAGRPEVRPEAGRPSISRALEHALDELLALRKRSRVQRLPLETRAALPPGVPRRVAWLNRALVARLAREAVRDAEGRREGLPAVITRLMRELRARQRQAGRQAVR